MKPMEAWSTISSNLDNYYKTRGKISQKEIEAEVVCFRALQEMEERRTAYIRRTGYLKSAEEVLKERERE